MANLERKWIGISSYIAVGSDIEYNPECGYGVLLIKLFKKNTKKFHTHETFHAAGYSYIRKGVEEWLII